MHYDPFSNKDLEFLYKDWEMIALDLNFLSRESSKILGVFGIINLGKLKNVKIGRGISVVFGIITNKTSAAKPEVS